MLIPNLKAPPCGVKPEKKFINGFSAPDNLVETVVFMLFYAFYGLQGTKLKKVCFLREIQQRY